MIYLDHNASSPLLPVARAAWLEAEERFPGNPSSPHRIGARADAALDRAREQLAGWLGCAAADVVWTSGATEAANTALHQLAAMSEPTAPVWVSAVEHPAVLVTARQLFGQRVHLIPVDRRGVVDLGWLARTLSRARPAFVAIMAANNETGVLQPWREAQAWCAGHGIPFLCDATQWCGRRAARGLGACDFAIGSAHKFGGPRGVGFLKTPARAAAMRPLLQGGSQQHGRRAGTENVAGVLALVAALEWCEQQISADAELPLRAARDQFESEVRAAMPAAAVNGAGVDRLWNTSSIVLPETDGRQRWVVKLDKAGFAVSTGSACASGSEKPSPVLTAMGLAAAEAGRAVRISASWLTPATAWRDLTEAMARIHREFTAPAASPR